MFKQSTFKRSVFIGAHSHAFGARNFLTRIGGVQSKNLCLVFVQKELVQIETVQMLTCRGHPGNHLHMRASVSGFAGFPSEIFTCSRSSNPRFGGSMKQHMNLHLRVPKHIHRPLDLHNYLITILPIPWNPEIWFFIRQGADTRVFANSCGSLKACGQKRTKCNPIKKENIQPFFPQCLKAFGHALALPYPA